jgi:translocation and assembly module TamB
MKRMLKRVMAAAAVVAVVGYGGVWWLLRSEWLREKVRARAVEEIEKATGGRAELGRLDFDPGLLSARVERFVLHGTEGPGAEPLVRAERIEVGMKILSFVKPNVDVGRIEIFRPQVHVTVDAEGRTNLPSPAGKRTGTGRGPVEEVLRLAADAFAVHDGEFSYDAKKHRFSASGRQLEASFDYDAKGPVYRGTVASKALEVQAGFLPRLPVDMAVTMTAGKDTVEFTAIRLQSAPSTVTGTGRLVTGAAPSGEFQLTLESDLSEAGRLFGAPAGRGGVRSAGKLVWAGGGQVRYEGDVRAGGLDAQIGGIRVRPVAVTGQVVATEKALTVTGLEVRAAEGRFQGKAALPGYGGYVDGRVEGFALRSALALAGTEPLGYDGVISGPVRLEGGFKSSFAVDGELVIAAGEDGVPLDGAVTMRYDRATGRVTLLDSYLRTPHARLDIAGTLTETLRVKVSCTDLADMEPALAWAGERGPLPVGLEKNGSLLFEGTVSGALRAPLVAGQLRAIGARWKDLQAEALSTTVVASADKLTLTRFSVTEGGSTLTGNGTIGLREWKADGGSAIDVKVEGRSLNVGNLRRQMGIEEPVEGLLHATAQIQGTVEEPAGELQIDWFRPSYGGEVLDRLRATVRHGQSTLQIVSMEATRSGARLTGAGTFTHGRGDWRSGRTAVSFQLTGLELGTLAAVQTLRKGTRGVVTAGGKAEARLVNGEARFTGLEGEARLENLQIDGKAYGELAATAAKAGNDEVRVTARGALQGAALTATSQWKLSEGYPGTAHMEFGALPFSVFDELRPTRVAAEPWPFQGSFRGSMDFAGPALDVERWRVDVTLRELGARPTRRATLPGRTTAQDFELRNDGPIRFRAEGRTVTIQAARFIAKDTNLSAQGSFSLAEKRPWDLQVNGQLDLAGLRTFSPDIVASGVATLQANIRGELASPQVFGALELKNATLNVDGVPNGLDKVNGRVLFNRRRATIENRLTAESGGGALALGGFIDFSSNDTFYRLQAEAGRVRIRYPEGVSTVANASVTLSGTTERSLLAGTVTVLRSGFTPRTDLGSLLAESGRAESTPKDANKFLANMQIDVKVRTVPETQFTTSLTNDLQAEANLQIRGTGARPVALGRITISQGDINFFGNKYSIKRGEVSFYNPTKVEPTLDLDLETRVRGVDVIVNFTGPIDKLNVSYRSDPPLQPGEIIALLTVGRTPGSSTVGSSQSGAKGSFLESGANSLLGSAISAPISSQLQRFFGVSRIKIDPTIAGLEGTPQARVTVEQQVSKDVTITFVTNLNRSQQQVVRFEWNLSKEWSLIALRDENGSFGVDFQVRKQRK